MLPPLMTIHVYLSVQAFSGLNEVGGEREVAVEGGGMRIVEEWAQVWRQIDLGW